MRFVRIIATVTFGIAALVLQERGNAATDLHCVSTGAQLKQAFGDANFAAEGVGQDIRIRSLDITVDASLVFDPAEDKDNKDFALTGGWNSDCSVQTLDAGNTLVHMSSADPANRLVTLNSDNHSYTVRGIHFDNVSTFKLNEPSCGNWQICTDTDYVTIEYNIFSRMAAFDVAIQDTRSLTVRNNLFYKFSGGGTLVGVFYGNDELSPNFSFNTLADMHCANAGNSALNFGTSTQAIFHHNIIQSDCAHDLFLGAPGSVALYNNLYSTVGGYSPGDVANNKVNADPGFVDPAGDNYNLRTTAPVSAAIDAGKILAEVILSGLNFPAQDLYGNPRLVGLHFDLGAIESPGPAPAGYVVTNINDSGSGSLRQAVYDANHAAGPQKITFNIPGTCPRKIGLLSHLDDIVEDLDIDGYSQPGSVENSADRGSGATLCVVVGPASGKTIDYSLRVPDSAAATNLQVRGIAFTGGHTSAALYLRGGSGHVIQGNAFGGVRPGGLDTLGDTNLFHLVVRANAAGVLIGGPDNADRNYFGSSGQTAILLRDSTSNGHIVRNNYIGLDPGGAVPQPLGNDGIAIVDSGYVQVIGNVIDAGSSGISISGPTASNISIKSNKIGIDAYGGQGATAANDDGIFVYDQAHFNEIGAYGGKTPSNTIANNNYAGVRIDATAGPNNTVRPNSIYNNGKAGSGLGIDLGTLGPLANDAGDADSGPNDGQNSPRLKASVPNPNTSRTVSGTFNGLPNAKFRIDVYRSPTCAGGNRGGDAKTLLVAPTTSGGTEVTTDASGKAAFTVTVAGADAPAYITAVATFEPAGGSSEIGACFYEDTIFSNGAEVEPL